MRLLSLAILLLVTACSTTGYYTQSDSKWRGKSAATLLQQKGTPNETIKTADGLTLMTYTTGHYENIPYSASSNTVLVVNRKGQTIGTGVPPPSRPLYITTCIMTVKVGRDQKIVSVEESGPRC
jgi:hypothetical protein